MSTKNRNERSEKRRAAAHLGSLPRRVRRPPSQRDWDKILRVLGPTGMRPAQVVVWALEEYRRICDNLQATVQKHELGLGGEKIDVLVCEEIDRLRGTQNDRDSRQGQRQGGHE